MKKENGKLIFYEPMSKSERLIILGGGHIGNALCDFAAKTGFEVWVVDERPEFASKTRFPEAAGVLCHDFEQAMDELRIRQTDYVVIVTRGHSCDGLCLSYLFNHTMPFYTGMIGSRKRVQEQLNRFRNQGIAEDRIKKVHTPIGLPIGAATPQEIAVSILAELIMEKRHGKKNCGIRTDLTDSMIKKAAACKEPALIVTLMQTEGSAPRKAGAKMIVYYDGRTDGTIGGGLGEQDAIKKALCMAGTGKALHYTFAMDASVAAMDGMACGGAMEVLIEDMKEMQEEAI